MKKLSAKITQQVIKMLPEMRKETQEELKTWGKYDYGEEFYSDDRLINALPFSAYEYVRLAKRIKVDKSIIIEWLNQGLFDEDTLKKVIAHALRRIVISKK
jgi:hypothetical protein